MASVTLWVTTIISAVLILIAGHISITLILPKLKDLLNPVIKDERAISALMTLLIILIAVLILKSEVDLLLTLENNVIKMIDVVTPALNVLLGFGKYVGYLVLGFVVVLGLKYLK